MREWTRALHENALIVGSPPRYVCMQGGLKAVSGAAEKFDVGNRSDDSSGDRFATLGS